MSLDSYPEIVWIRERFSHMGKHSGYDQLPVALEAMMPTRHSIWLESLPNQYFAKFVVEFLARRVKATPFFSKANLWAEIRALKYHFFAPKIIHVLYGENNLGLLAIYYGRSKTKLVVTLHQPLAWWEENAINVRTYFQKIDALIVLSTAEKLNFESRLDQNVIFVPHGINTQFFSPVRESIKKVKFQREGKRCIFVGHWLRDFTTLKATIEMIGNQDKRIFYDLVIPEISWMNFEEKRRILALKKLPNVVWHRNIDDSHLRELYQNANLLLLPLIDSTANNAILEAMSCGLPIVTNETSGISDYTEVSYARVCPAKDPVAMAEAVMEIADDPVIQKSMAKAARETAVEKFDWSRIANQVRGIYDSLL